jgi:hypothetical protein
LAEVARHHGRSGEAFPLLEQALAWFREAGDKLGTAFALHGLAGIAATEGDAPRAAARFAEALALWHEAGERISIAGSLEGLAAVAADQAEYARAARWWGAAAVERHARQAPIPAVDRETYQRAVAHARAALGASPFDAAWAMGSRLSLDAAVAEAITFAPTERDSKQGDHLPR